PGDRAADPGRGGTARGRARAAPSAARHRPVHADHGRGRRLRRTVPGADRPGGQGPARAARHRGRPGRSDRSDGSDAADGLTPLTDLTPKLERAAASTADLAVGLTLVPVTLPSPVA